MAKAEQIVKKLLLQIAKEQHFEHYDLKIEFISSGGANYTSTLYNVTCAEKARCVHMFAKVAALGDATRNESPKYYQTETFFYTKLLKVYEQLEDKYQVPHEHRLVFAKFYGCNTKLYEETIVLENLVKAGYSAFDRFKSVDWEYAKSATTELAKLFALSYAYGEYHPVDFKKITDELNFEYDVTSGGLAAYFQKVTTTAFSIIREENREKLEKFFETFGPDKYRNMYKTKGRQVLGHGDYRPSNLMHKVREDGTVDIKIVDLQTMQGHSPVIDLLFFIFTGTDQEFRAQYYEKLLDHYYTQLSAAMKRLHLDPEKIFSRKDFEDELTEKLPYGLVFAVFSLPVVTVETENAPVVNEDMKISDFPIEKSTDLYKERLNGVVNDYVRWGLLT